jgi:hypothetical protein
MKLLIWRKIQMCNKKKCEHPEKLKAENQECTPEQIKECHGDVKEHPCSEDKQRRIKEK